MPPKQKKTYEQTLELEAGNAAMADLGKMLGPTGANTRAIKQEYDAGTAGQQGDIVPVVVTVYENRAHTLQFKTPPTTFLIRKALGINKGATNAGRETSGSLTEDQLRNIAETKLADLEVDSVEKAMTIIAGTAKSMGVKVPA